MYWHMPHWLVQPLVLLTIVKKIVLIPKDPNSVKVIVGDKTDPQMCSGGHQISYVPVREIMWSTKIASDHGSKYHP